MTDLRTAAQQALECLKGVARGKYDGNAAGVCAALEAALAQQAEPDHETRAELAEQQVVQLAEERDHYRNLWQQAQQPNPPGCDHCNHPLYAATKCRVCGRVTA